METPRLWAWGLVRIRLGASRRGPGESWGSEFTCPPATQLCVHDNYRNNPFHNFRHCFCVTQMMYSMVWLCNLQVSPAKEHPPGVIPVPPRALPWSPGCEAPTVRLLLWLFPELVQAGMVACVYNPSTLGS